MTIFDFIKKINEVYGRNYQAGTPEQQKINVAIAQILRDHEKDMIKGA